MTEEQAIDCVSRQAVKEGMIKYGFRAPDMTVTEFIEDQLLSVTPEISVSSDCVSRAEVQKFVSYIQSIKDSHNEQDIPINYGTICDLVIRGWKLMELPSVTPTHGACKDCKHFHNVRKDFNVCDLWTIACTDNHYCADFEKRGDKNEDN